MQIGRFFALGQGRVGQYLSPRVLNVRSPFRRTSLTGPSQFCCIGFGSLRQAQKFLRSLAHPGLSVELRQSQMFKNSSYEVVVRDRPDLASTLAAWERQIASRPERLTVIAPETAPVAA
ncbi:hypothetical protein H6F67_24390 [Microcoleus sp. FACHB-1515]|uniref:hypothetical protein n=1 Tax=Cyanophyceae TaxID=3028117 RepID=UPI0016888D10|nr:hypothetical protein [Microcoleus sp. FACHB-1515]MBD2092991.1 hypothetical protein [Microcoleus sp. FACHB-1515]